MQTECALCASNFSSCEPFLLAEYYKLAVIKHTAMQQARFCLSQSEKQEVVAKRATRGYPDTAYDATVCSKMVDSSDH